MTTLEHPTTFDGEHVNASAIASSPLGPNWTVTRVTSLLAGSFTLFSLAMGRLHNPRWRLMTALIGSNLILQGVAGWCPASLVIRRLGVPE